MKVIVTVLLGVSSLFFYMGGYFFFFYLVQKVLPCTIGYSSCGEFFCSSYLWYAMVQGVFYLLFISTIFLMIRLLSRSFKYFLLIIILPTFFMFLVQVSYIYGAFDLNNIGPDAIRVDNFNNLYLFTVVNALLVMGMLWTMKRKLK